MFLVESFLSTVSDQLMILIRLQASNDYEVEFEPATTKVFFNMLIFFDSFEFTFLPFSVSSTLSFSFLSKEAKPDQNNHKAIFFVTIQTSHRI